MKKILTAEQWIKQEYGFNVHKGIYSEGDMVGYAIYVRDFTLGVAAEKVKSFTYKDINAMIILFLKNDKNLQI